MGIEQRGEHLERRGVTLREKLEKILEAEPAGSPRILGIADFAARTVAERDLASRTYESYSIAKLTAINETIRVRELGPDADEYSTAFEEGKAEILPLYVAKARGRRRLQRLHRKMNEEDFNNLVFRDAAGDLYVDVSEINRQKSKRI